MKRYWSIVLLVVLALGYGGCATPTPQVIEKEVIKTVEVVETVEVVKEVEKEIVVTPTATPEPAPLAPKEGGTLNLHLELAPPSLYPPYDMDRSSRMVYELVYDYLFFFNDAQEVVPELGKAYEVSADGLTYTITLRDDVKWHDGEPFTAKDVKFTFEVACSEASPLYGDYSKIVGCADFHEGNAQEVEGIQIVDDYTVKLVLAEPNAAFPIALVYQVVPEHIYAGMDLDTAKRTAWQLVGTGPFKFVKYVEDQYFEFDANPDYFKGKPHIDKVFMKIADVDTAIAMLEKGEVDFIADLPATEVDRLSENPNVSILETPNTNWPWILEYNFKSEKLKDKRVRQAFMYAVDRQAYVDSILQGHGQVYNQPFLFPGWAAPPDAELNAYPYDPEKAKQLLQEAGWDPNWVVEVLYYPGNKLRGDFAEIFQQYMADVGVKVDLLSIDVARAIDRLNAGDFEILLSGAGAKPDPSSQAPYFACDSVPENGGWNYGRYCNPEVDAAFERGTQVFTLEERAPIYQEAAKILNDDVPWLYIAIPNYISATSTRITGMHYNPNLTEGRYFDIEQWMLAQ